MPNDTDLSMFLPEVPSLNFANIGGSERSHAPTDTVAVSMSGYFGGRRARLGGIVLGVLLVADLGRANLRWVVTWDWVQKYASNPVVDMLREKPYEHRVAMLPFVHTPPA